MNATHPIQDFCHRALFILVITPCLIISLIEVGPGLLQPTRALAATSPVEDAVSAGAVATYRWNLHQEDLPLISLPDHVGGNLDLSLTYSLDQFQLPLFQTLYFNKVANKYLLMVVTKESSRAEFIVLDSTERRDRFQSEGNAPLRLQVNGDVKLLTARDDTTYTFSRFADGEFHCSQINNPDGVAINLGYTNDSSIETIADHDGRTVNFNYTDNYLSSVTQTWGIAESKLKQTWAIVGRMSFGNSPAKGTVLTRMEMTKRIPTNAITPGYTKAMADSDATLARIFGGTGAVAAANGFEPRGLALTYPLYRGDQVADDGRILRGHLSFAMHLYGSDDGTGTTELYVPAGFICHSDFPTPTDAAVTFYYPLIGNLKDVTLAVFHVDNFQISDEGSRVRIGTIGGRGGSVDTYRHSHLEFYKGNTGLPPSALRVGLRIDPVAVFSQIKDTVSQGR